MNKLYPTAEAALEGLLHDGMTICAGGFGLCGIPERLIDAIRDKAADPAVALNWFDAAVLTERVRNPQTQADQAALLDR